MRVVFRGEKKKKLKMASLTELIKYYFVIA